MSGVGKPCHSWFMSWIVGFGYIPMCMTLTLFRQKNAPKKGSHKWETRWEKWNWWKDMLIFRLGILKASFVSASRTRFSFTKVESQTNNYFKSASPVKPESDSRHFWCTFLKHILVHFNGKANSALPRKQIHSWFSRIWSWNKQGLRFLANIRLIFSCMLFCQVYQHWSSSWFLLHLESNYSSYKFHFHIGAGTRKLHQSKQCKERWGWWRSKSPLCISPTIHEWELLVFPVPK